MSFKVRIIYTKPNAEVSLHTPSTEYTALIDTFFNAGKITQKPVESIDGLTHTYTMIFDSVTSSNEFSVESLAGDNLTTRENHCNSNSISYSILSTKEFL